MIPTHSRGGSNENTTETLAGVGVDGPDGVGDGVVYRWPSRRAAFYVGSLLSL